MIGVSTINRTALLGVKSLSFTLETARPTSMKIRMKRDPSSGPNALLFELTTNGDGTEKKFDGSFELKDASGAVTHVVDYANGSAQSYETSVPEDNNMPALESVVIIAPKFTIKAAGKVVEFEARETTRHVVK